jgi:hypothetical protein
MLLLHSHRLLTSGFFDVGGWGFIWGDHVACPAGVFESFLGINPGHSPPTGFWETVQNSVVVIDPEAHSKARCALETTEVIDLTNIDVRRDWIIPAWPRGALPFLAGQTPSEWGS